MYFRPNRNSSKRRITMRLIVGQLAKEDYTSCRKLFDEAYYEYLEELKRSNLQQYHKQLQNKRRVTSSRFNFYVKTGSSFVAEKDGEVVGYVATQTIPTCGVMIEFYGSNTWSQSTNIGNRE